MRPAKASSVWAEMPFMRGPDGARRLREWRETHQTIREQHTNRHARVLAHDWAHPRLCHILGITDATRWNGYIPSNVDHEGRTCSSPVRRALLELLREVATAEALDHAGG